MNNIAGLSKPIKEKKSKASGSPEVITSKTITVQPQNSPQRDNSNFKDTGKSSPPIYVTIDTDINQFTENLKVIKFGGRISNLANNKIKINCQNSDEYRVITSDLETKRNAGSKIEWHSFADKNNRPFKVMARGLDPDTKEETIVEELKNRGFNILSAHNILKTNVTQDPNDENKRIKTRSKLRLFMLTFEQNAPINDIYAIKNIAYQTVKIEALRKSSNRIVQCKNCQGYNHVRIGCHRTPRCVKCAGRHLATNCKAVINTPKCANCGEGHTANYRGCIVAKELQKMRNESVSKKKKDGKSKPVRKYEESSIKPGNMSNNNATNEANNITYADKASETAIERNKSQINRISDNEPIYTLLQNLVERFDQQVKYNKMKFDMIENLLANT